MAKSGKKLLGLTTLSFSLKDAKFAVPQSVILKKHSQLRKECENIKQNDAKTEIGVKNNKYK